MRFLILKGMAAKQTQFTGVKSWFNRGLERLRKTGLDISGESPRPTPESNITFSKSQGRPVREADPNTNVQPAQGGTLPRQIVVMGRGSVPKGRRESLSTVEMPRGSPKGKHAPIKDATLKVADSSHNALMQNVAGSDDGAVDYSTDHGTPDAANGDIMQASPSQGISRLSIQPRKSMLHEEMVDGEDENHSDTPLETYDLGASLVVEEEVDDGLMSECPEAPGRPLDEWAGMWIGNDLAAELGLEEEGVLQLEDKFNSALVRVKEDLKEEHEQVLQANMENVRKDRDDTTNAMQEKWEAKYDRVNSHWSGEIKKLHNNLDELTRRYETSLQTQQNLITQGAKLDDKATSLEEEVVSLKEERAALLREKEAQQWLDAEYPYGYDESCLSNAPNHLKDEVRRVWRVKLSKIPPLQGGKKGGMNPPPRPREPRGHSHTTQYPPRYTDAVQVVREGDSLTSMKRHRDIDVSTVVDGYDASSHISDKPLMQNGLRVKAINGKSGVEEDSVSLQSLNNTMMEMQRQQQSLLNEMKAEFVTKIASNNEANKRELNALRETMAQTDRRKREEEEIARTVSYIDTRSRNTGPIQPPPGFERENEEAVMSFYPQEQRGHYDTQPACAMGSGVPSPSHQPWASRPHSGGMGGTPKAGYLPSRVEIPKHEETAIGLFSGGTEARRIWPGFHANFVHLAKSYHWDYNVKGTLLSRKCRDHALQVIKSLPEQLRMDYDSLVRAFNKAYVPKEWARTYRGALSSRKQKEGESLIKYAAALRELALTAFPCTEDENTDQVREERCLDQFLRGMRDSLLSVFVNNAKPDTMEAAISAAEGFSAILAKDETDLPSHPDKRDGDTPLSSLVVASVADSQQPKAKPYGQKPFIRNDWGEKGKAKQKDAWDNNNPMQEMMIKAFEDMCSRRNRGGNHQRGGYPQRGGNQQRGGQAQRGGYNQNSNANNPKGGYGRPSDKQPPKPNYQNSRPRYDQKGYKRPADTQGDDVVPRCYKCQRPGHIRRDCVFATDECAVIEWYCEEHAPRDECTTHQEDFQ